MFSRASEALPLSESQTTLHPSSPMRFNLRSGVQEEGVGGCHAIKENGGFPDTPDVCYSPWPHTGNECAPRCIASTTEHDEGV